MVGRFLCQGSHIPLFGILHTLLFDLLDFIPYAEIEDPPNCWSRGGLGKNVQEHWMVLSIRFSIAHLSYVFERSACFF